MSLSIEDMAVFCKKKGFVFLTADIYGSLSGFFDYGHLGVELKNNIKDSWYKFTVRDRENVVAIDGSIITNPSVWKASGHVDCFADLILTTKNSKKKIRADHFIEEQLKINAEGMSAKQINDLVKKHNLTFNGERFEDVKDFNLMFKTEVGAEGGIVSYLRPETCQSIFPNFRLVMETSRQKLPFGIAQVGKAFRNEISPRDFLFRQREFEQMELEFFFHPNEKMCKLLTEKHKQLHLQFLSAEAQECNRKEGEETTISDMLKKNLLSEWHAYWIVEMYLFYTDVLKVKAMNLRIREHMKKELSHYSSATFDFDYRFPFGFMEVMGIADRGQYDLKQHGEHSGEKLEVLDEPTGKKIIPRVIEPSQGLDRLFLLLLFEAYDEDKKRGNIILHLPPKLAPYFCAVFPLVKNKPEILAKAEKVFELVKKEFTCYLDSSGSVGRRYARADEIGVPYCITIDFESLDDGCVTVRNRETTEQERVKISSLKEKLSGMRSL